jgi:hypothetical protein
VKNIGRRIFVKSTLAAAACMALPGGYLRAQTAGRDVAAVSSTGRQLTLSKADIEDFAKSLRGQLILPDSEGYEQARKRWNGSFDRHPALIARCTGAADVVQAVKFAKAHELLTAVRGGGHSISGQSSCDNGLVIDLQPMKAIRIDPAHQLAAVQPGVVLGEFDREAQAFGLVTTLGTASTTGIAGLTLGGGMGRLARRFGLACDNVRGVDIVTANGELLHADESENADLFWAVRGGGGNFGVVTTFEYQLHPLAHDVLSGYVMFPFDKNVRKTLLALTDFCANAPDEMYLNPMTGGSGATRTVGFEVCYSGSSLAEGERLLAPLLKLGKSLGPPPIAKPYVEVQRFVDRGLPAGRNYYFKSGFLPHVTAKTVDELVDIMGESPAYLMGMPLIHLRGAVARVKPDATAYWNRDAYHDVAVWAAWDNRADNERNVSAVRGFFQKLEHLTKGYYVNTDTPDDERRLRETYGGNYDRLVKVKTQHDPTNLFRLNANIKPGAPA